MVLAGSNVQLCDDRGSFRGVQNKLEESITLVLRQLAVNLFGFRRGVLEISEHGVRLPVVHQTVRAWLQQLRFAPAIVFRVLRKYVGNLRRELRSKLPLRP